jgi:septum formation protein
MTKNPPLILASQSPRRAQLLEMLGLSFEVVPADLDETYRPGEVAAAHAQRLAREKAVAVAKERAGALVIGADTVVVVDGIVLGKPKHGEEAVAMLMQLQGREHIVATGIAVASDDQVRDGIETVRVQFRAFDASTAHRYVETGEPLDKAGAYGIQGYGSTLVHRIEGDFFAVMGMPIVRLITLLETLGWRYDFTGLQRVP